MIEKIGEEDCFWTIKINGEKVHVYENGSFVWVYALQKGKNNVVLKSTYKRPP